MLDTYEIILSCYCASNVFWTRRSLAETGIFKGSLSELIWLYYPWLTSMLFWGISLIKRNSLFDQLTFSLFSLNWWLQYLFLCCSHIWKTWVCTNFIQSCIWIDAPSIINKSCLGRSSGIKSVNFVCVTRHNLVFIF